NGQVTCPECHTSIKVGQAGLENFQKCHVNSKQCKENKRKQEQEERTQKQKEQNRKAFSGFFNAPRKATVPSTVSTPPLITTSKPKAEIPKASSSHQVLLDIPCQGAARLLAEFRSRIESLPENIPIAEYTHPLAPFAGDPAGSVPAGEDAWEVWNGPLDTLLQQTPSQLQGLVARGPLGLEGLCNLFEYLARHHNIGAGLLEGKIGRMIKAIDELSPLSSQPHPPPLHTDDDVENVPELIDVEGDELDSDIELVEPTFSCAYTPPSSEAPKPHVESSKTLQPPALKMPCPGIEIQLPEGQSAHSSYPFGLHDSPGYPWDYAVTGGHLVLYAKACKKIIDSKSRGPCKACVNLRDQDSNLEGILRRLETGVHENSRLVFHGIGGLVRIIRQKTGEVWALRLQKLNDAQKLAGKAVAIDHFKQWVMAVGSGKVERVDRLVRVNLAQKGGIANLLKLYDQAAKGVYHPRTYTEEDDLRGILLWKLGGARVAGIGQRALGLPSISTLRRRTLIKPLIVSSGAPKVSEVEANITNSFAPITSEIEAASDDGIIIPHQVLMFDELKVETRARVCPLTNKILGPCREHVANTSVEFASEREVLLLLEALEKGEVHMAVDGTVGAIGLLSGNTRLYGARGVLISGDCKRETGLQHVGLINTTYVAAKKTGARTISIASDGEARRGEAFVRYAFKRNLRPESPIYEQLSPLVMMDLRTGDDDLTCDKDAKHVFKRLRNLVIRTKGSLIHGVHITPAIIRSHLHDNGVSLERSGYLLDPKDKQDVKLAYDLLHEIWSLPPAPKTSTPAFQSSRESLILLGSFYRHLLLPYICIDLSLSEQLTHLSAAAHILMSLYADGRTPTPKLLMPTQLYIDIMIMIKNIYFCVAKAKADNPLSQFWIILLGTDRLESLFGILRTMIGNDTNLDLLQLGLRLANTTEVATILAKYPHWDRPPRQLRLPALSKEGFEIHQEVDHIGPSSWRGDVYVSQVVLQTCWKMGRQMIEDESEDLRPIISSVCMPSRTIFSQLGNDLVNSSREEGDVDDTQEMDTEVPSTQVSPLGIEAEDAVAKEALDDTPASGFRPFFELNGVKISKAKYLKQSFERYQKTGSTDRLRRVADGERYFSASTRARDSTSYVLARSSISLSKMKLLHLVPATIEDTPDLKHDWKWSFRRLSTIEKVPGVLIQPINPDVSTRLPNRPYYLCESSFLLTTGASLLEQTTAVGNVPVPEIKPSSDFPYRKSNGSVCFLCENEGAERNVVATDQGSMCDPPVPLDRKKGQRVLEHMAAHILYDPLVDRSTQPCGLCLQPWPALDEKKSRCAGLVTFNYATAEASTEASPTSNVPMKCPVCKGTSAPAIWKYNLEYHIRSQHKSASPAAHKDLFSIGEYEMKKLKETWDKRQKTKKTRPGKSTTTTNFQVSEAHSSRMAGRYVTKHILLVT
ncbi:hypothetical protein B0H34DRAFT_668291, partial [Crassisporium funariophilum]